MDQKFKRKYRIIYADPGWRYQNAMFGTGKSVSSRFSPDVRYRTESDATLKSLRPVLDVIGADDSALFLWTTGPKLDVAVDVMRAWGFTFKQVAWVWDKHRQSPGHYTTTQCEFLLVGTRGQFPKAEYRNEQLVSLSGSRRHSQKPDDIWWRLNKMYPELDKIELFARGRPSHSPGQRPWEATGLEYDGINILDVLSELRAEQDVA